MCCQVQLLISQATSLGGCVQGVCTRVARVGGRCAVVWLASEWHHVVCAVCVLHIVLKMEVFPSCKSSHFIGWVCTGCVYESS